jgi:hypothetical protein
MGHSFTKMVFNVVQKDNFSVLKGARKGDFRFQKRHSSYNDGLFRISEMQVLVLKNTLNGNFRFQKGESRA